MGKQLFKGTGGLTRLLLRQNRFKILLWLFGLVGVTFIVANVYPSVYTTQEDIMGFALTMENPAMVAMLGSLYSVEEYNLGAVFANEMLLFTAIAAVVMNILFVSSSTRDDEEEGGLEMVRALSVGRLTYLTASGVMILLVNGILFLLTGLGLGMIDGAGFNWESAFLYAAVLAGTGFFFAGLTALFAQLADTARGTSGLAMGALILAYIVRAFGDVQNETVSLFSPLGWAVRTKVFVNNQWWPIATLLAGAMVLSVAALYLNLTRDMNAGFFPARQGKTQASGFLKTQIGLTWHLEKTTLIGWTVVLFLLSAAFGAILGELETFFSDMDIIQAYFSEASSSSLTEQFMALLLSILSVFTAAPVTAVILKLKKEERLGRIENFYSRSVSRNKVLLSYYGVSFAGVIGMQIMSGLGVYLTGNQALEAGLDLGMVLEAVLVYVPAVWLIIGLATLLIGTFPRGTGLVWLYIVFSLIVIYVGDLLDLPEWANNLSSFTHVPQILTEDMDWTSLGRLSLVAIVFTLIGFVGYNKRDIQNE